jgi:hypothetical protein
MDNEMLRVLISDVEVPLHQTVIHDGLDYPLYNPSIRLPPNGGDTDYVGYLIVAPKIVIADNLLATRGHDLVPIRFT